MSSFDPARLSPLPKEPLTCELPYGLSWDDLIPILPDLDARERARAQAFASHDKQGLNGGDNSIILTLRYPTGKNQFRTETIFIKYSPDQKKAEAQKYQFIASHNIPTPRLLASFQKGEAEVILLEFLPSIGINFSSASEVNSLLHLLANLNSIQAPPVLFQPLPGLPQAEFDELVRAALVALAHDQPLYNIDPPRWFEAYQLSQQAVRFMPLAINHNELYFQQVGWAQRGPSRELVIFDLETMTLSPQFTDIASILFPLSIYTGRDQVDLFQIYLDRLSQLTHFELNFNEAFRELRFVRILGSYESLPWLTGEARHLVGVDTEGLSMTAKCMWDDLTNLGLL